METIQLISVLVAMTGVILGGVWFLMTHSAQWGIKSFRLKQAEETLKKLPREQHASSIASSSRNIELITKTLEENNAMLVEISKWTMRVDKDMIDKLLKKQSPLKMTEAGRYLFEKSGAAEATDKILDLLISAMEQVELRTEYDIEQKALEVILKNIGNAAFDSVKKFIYYSPDTITVETTGETVQFDFFAIVRLMSIKLRDVYMAKHNLIKEQTKANK